MNRLEIFKSTTLMGYKLFSFLEMMSANNNGECTFSNDKLKEMLNVKSNTTIVNAKKELKELGLIDFQTQRSGLKLTTTKFYIIGRLENKQPDNSGRLENVQGGRLKIKQKNISYKDILSIDINNTSTSTVDTNVCNNDINDSCLKIKQPLFDLYADINSVLDRVASAKTKTQVKKEIETLKSIDSSRLTEKQSQALLNRYNALMKLKDTYFKRRNTPTIASKLKEVQSSNDIKDNALKGIFSDLGNVTTTDISRAKKESKYSLTVHSGNIRGIKNSMVNGESPAPYINNIKNYIVPKLKTADAERNFNLLLYDALTADVYNSIANMHV